MAVESNQKPLSRRGCRYFLKLGLVAVLGLIFAYNCIIPAYIGYRLTTVRSPVTDHPDTLFGFNYEDVSFETSDKLRLSAWYIPSYNRAAIILVHGSTGNRIGTVAHAAMLAEHGYGVLMLDLRGHGNSDGDTFNMGWDSNADIAVAVQYLSARDDVDDNRIGAMGLSMGGEVVLQAAAANPAIHVVISDGAGARTFDDFMQIPGVAKFSMMPFIWSQFTAHRIATRLTPPPSFVDLLPQIAPRPLLLIANGQGQWGGRLLTDVYFAAAGEPKILWNIPDATHVGGLSSRPEEYQAKVIGFLDILLL